MTHFGQQIETEFTNVAISIFNFLLLGIFKNWIAINGVVQYSESKTYKELFTQSGDMNRQQQYITIQYNLYLALSKMSI